MLKNYAKDNKLEFVVGLDEVGRGSFAGPVVTAAVILPPNFKSELIKDSKKLKAKTKMRAAYELIMRKAIAISCQAGSVKQINKYDIDVATMIAMHKCLDEITLNFKVDIEQIIVDGDKWENYHNIPYQTIQKGDDTYLSIAAAAIVAKVRRDEYMVRLAKKFPNHNFERSKGYGCTKHYAGLNEHGRTPYHRDKYVNTWEKNQAKKLAKGKN